MKIKSQTLSNLLTEILDQNKKVDSLINMLKNDTTIEEDKKYAYQAFCCAILARQAEKMLQKGEYIQAYYKYICNALAINENCFEARLFRFIIEKSLTKVEFVSHHEEDKQFLRATIENISYVFQEFRNFKITQ